MDKSNRNNLAAVFAGFAIGESLSWSTPFNRSQLMPAWLTRIRTDMEREQYNKRITSMPVPFSLNQNSKPLYPGSADLTEWMAWTGLLLLDNGGMLNATILESAWKRMTQNAHLIHSRISIHAALKNISRGLTAPESGRFNPHHFDDAVLPRALVIGAFHSNDPDLATSFSALDASFTHYEEGVYAARALAGTVSRACHGAVVSELIDTALMELPADSLSYRTVKKALDCASRIQGSPAALALALSREVCQPEYSYGNIAHEILACTLALIRLTGGGFDKTLSAAALVPRTGAGLMAVSGALAAALSGLPAHSWPDDAFFTLQGDFIPDVKGVSLTDLAAKLETPAETVNDIKESLNK